ncbi:barstar family protein [Ornithinimicrobium sp. Y1847]|uniref:barstar family protein n=1 Tax=unclassified Ornithinimicrobium TaxID=2615080 RepID=UPI003B66D0A4
MIVASADDAHLLLEQLREDGYDVAVASTDPEDFRATQASIAKALRLPESAGRNLDALADSLRDLGDHWPGPVALLWEDAESLARTDGRHWWILAEILDEADLAVIAAGARRSTIGDQP